MTSTSHDPRAWQRPEGDLGERPASAHLVDPEDDLPSSTYAGDFETTAIPRYDSNTGGESGFALLGDPEPLPYVQPSDGRQSAFGAEPTEIEPDDGRTDPADTRRGTQDLGLMLLRVGLGALLIAHGLRTAFGWWGGSGLAGFEQSLGELGYQHAAVLTYVAVGGQIGAGVLLVLGLFTPLAAAGALAYLVNALLAAVSAQPDYVPFFLPEGHEYEIALIVVAVAVILSGPGRYGFDAGRGWARRPFLGSIAALVLGIGVGVAVWVFLNGANPLA